VGAGVFPDLAGFAEAQQRLRSRFCRVVTFYRPTDALWSPDVPLDEQTGQPFDPTIKPASGGAIASASAVASVVYMPLQGVSRDRTVVDQIGRHSKQNKDLILDISERDVASGALRFELDGEQWEIVDTKLDGIGDLQRIIVYGEARE
jgi:hypothetical protein